MRSLLLLSMCLLMGTTLHAQETNVPLKVGPSAKLTRDASKPPVTVFTVEAPGAHFWSSILPAEPSLEDRKGWVVAFDYFSLSGAESLSVMFRNSEGDMVPIGSAPLPVAETWQSFSIDLDVVGGDLGAAQLGGDSRFHFSVRGKEGTRFQLRHLRLRAPTEKEIRAKAERDAVRESRKQDAAQYLSYLRDWYPGEVTSVVVKEKVVIIKGSASEGMRLEELPPHRRSHEPAVSVEKLREVSGEFEVEIPRIAVNHRDRALSRWRLVDSESGVISSLARWADRMEIASRRDLERLTATHQKGLGGMVPVDDGTHEIFELGIEHATINVVFDGAFSLQKKAGFVPFEFEGTTYYYNPRFVHRKDRTIKTLSEQGVIVTCILLIGNHEGAAFKHPEAEARGTYAMPNLTTPESTRAYRAAIDFLAERYTRADGEFGRISNWVMHNEIDQARTWTNMGEQPLARYLESYTRSARFMHHTARLYDPSARVFISLTHHWTKPSLGVGAYTVREMLDLWAEMNRAEGDFEWGVAYHPYPQNLRDPNAWEDEEAVSSFDTPYITPRNIEVLPAYLNRPEMVYQGSEPRAILLSEQGFNTPTLSEEDQKRQVAGLVYQFRKLKLYPQIEAYHLHRYQDMPDREGGLRLGIIDENGNRKLGWEAYAAIGTGTEDEAKFDAIADAILPEEAPATFQRPETPNIVLIMADDLGWSDTTPYLSGEEDFYETPAIAQLASQGSLYRNAYAASPLCSPTRASVLTGQYPGRVRLTTPNCHTPTVILDPTVPTTGAPSKRVLEPGTRTRFPNSYVTIAEQLKAANYATAFVGKWHLGRAPYFPDQQGFDLVIGGREHPGPPGGFFAPWPIDTIQKAPEGTHIDDQITTETIEWLKDRKADEPFFLNLWYYSVHAPFQAKPALIEKYRAKAASLPENAPRKNPVMAAMIETLDDNVGRILATLDELGMKDNTLVVFTSDNGGNEYNLVEGITPTNNAPLAFGKGNIGDGGQRVPFILRWPGKIEPNTTRDELVSSIDLFPTILAASGQHAVPAQPIDGIDLLSEVPEDRAIFCHFPHSPAATGTLAATSVRRGPWKLTRYYADGPEQTDRLVLYEVEKDPGETENLLASQPELAAELNELISENLAETESLVPVANPNYQLDYLSWKPGGVTEMELANGQLIVRSSDRDPRFSATTFGPARGSVSVVIAMTHDREESVQPKLYWSTQNSPKISSDQLTDLVEIAPNRYRANLELEPQDRLKEIRIDPAKGPGTYTFDSIQLIDWKTPAQKEGKMVRHWTFQ